MKGDKETKQVQRKYKAVIFVGDNIDQRGFIANYIRENHLSDEDVMVVAGSIDQVDLSSLDLDKNTDKDTLFMVVAHGVNQPYKGEGNKPNYLLHEIGHKLTGEFFNELRIAANHEISAILFSCHGGGTLKRKEIGSGISLMIRSSSKYTTVSFENLERVTEILNWKVRFGLANKKIFVKFAKLDQETIHYKNKNEKEPVKLSRIGKFSLKDFSIESVRKAISQIDSSPTYDKFIGKLQAALVEKLSPENIRNFIANRGDAEFKKLHSKRISFKNIGKKNSETKESKEEPTKELNDDQIKDYVSKLLIIAINRDDFDLIQAIISQYGREILNVKPDRAVQNPLVFSITRGKTEIIPILVAAGADPNLVIDGMFPLSTAINQSNHETIRTLLRVGANPDLVVDQVSALAIAIKKNDLEVAKILLEEGKADPNLIVNGVSILTGAIFDGNLKMVEFLLEAKADPNLIDAIKTPPLIFALQQDPTGIKGVSEILINNKNTNLDQPDENGNTALIVAVKNNRLEIVELLVTKGANINIKGEEGLNALEVAKQNGFKDIEKYLEKVTPKKNILKTIKANILGTTKPATAVVKPVVKQEVKEGVKPASTIKQTQTTAVNPDAQGHDFR